LSKRSAKADRRARAIWRSGLLVLIFNTKPRYFVETIAFFSFYKDPEARPLWKTSTNCIFRIVNGSVVMKPPQMKPPQKTRLNEWLLGSTIMCPRCGCIWLVPALQHGENYRCRQCGCDVPRGSSDQAKPDSFKTGITELQQ
jgi:predicted RNA-binding Zn-ribbon protein involved in translation (DUF1610 family)